MISTPLDRAVDNKVHSQDYIFVFYEHFLHNVMRAVSSLHTMTTETGLLSVVADHVPKTVPSRTTNIVVLLVTTDCRYVKL